MSTLNVRFIQGLPAFGNEISVPSGYSLSVAGSLSCSTLSATTSRTNAIQHTNGTSALTIDASGRVSHPAVPAFCASSQANTRSTTAGNVLDFSTVLFNNGGHYSTSTYRFTAPVAGVYQFHGIYWDQTGTTYTQVCWRRNGSQVGVNDNALIAKGGNSNNADQTHSGSLLISLAANDYIDLAVRNGTNTISWYGAHSWFMGFLVG